MNIKTKSRPAKFLARLAPFAKKKRQLGLPKFGFDYIMALLLDVQRKSLSAISAAIGVHVCQISRLLSSPTFVAAKAQWTLCRQLIEGALSATSFSNGRWKVYIIVDSTILQRSSSQAENIQKLNNGYAWKDGHRLTNVLLHIGDKWIPLPPIAHKSRSFCESNHEPYLTEGERLMDYLSSQPFKQAIKDIPNTDIVVLADAGYDNRDLQRFILERKTS